VIPKTDHHRTASREGTQPLPSIYMGPAAFTYYPLSSCRRTFAEGGVMIGMVDIPEDYEEGYLDTQETLELFAELIYTGAGVEPRKSLPAHGALPDRRRIHYARRQDNEQGPSVDPRRRAGGLSVRC
jgi:hypothetical protein